MNKLLESDSLWVQRFILHDRFFLNDLIEDVLSIVL